MCLATVSDANIDRIIAVPELAAYLVIEYEEDREDFTSELEHSLEFVPGEGERADLDNVVEMLSGPRLAMPDLGVDLAPRQLHGIPARSKGRLVNRLYGVRDLGSLAGAEEP